MLKYYYICLYWLGKASFSCGLNTRLFFTLFSLTGISSLSKSDYIPASLDLPNLMCSNIWYLCGLGQATWARNI